MQFKKLLVAIDFSEPSRDALRTAYSMAAETGAELVLLHVVESGPGAPEIDPTVGVFPEDVDGELERWQLEAQGAGAPIVSTRIAVGPPWHEIIQAARKDATYDLIVVGTHGRTGLEHLVLGSVAEKIVRHAPCSVLVVRTPIAE
jgi:universal stress protein A